MGESESPRVFMSLTISSVVVILPLLLFLFLQSYL